MKKILYSNGDSFVAGMECLGNENASEHNKEFSFPKHVATALNCETYINNAYNGATNNFIFNNTIFDLIELERQGHNPADVFVIIGFTSLHRLEIDASKLKKKYPLHQDTIKHNFFPMEVKDFDMLFVNPTRPAGITDSDGNYVDISNSVLPFCVNYLWTDSIQIPAQEARIISLHEFLKSKGYDHIFVNTCSAITGTSYANMSCPNFYYLNYTSFYEFGQDNYPSERRTMNHFSSFVHEKYAIKLIDYIKTQGLISKP